jgi:hypothetical protein
MVLEEASTIRVWFNIKVYIEILRKRLFRRLASPRLREITEFSLNAWPI